jgi:hypothetical protein
LDDDLKQLLPPDPSFKFSTAKVPEMADFLSVNRASEVTGIRIGILYKIARVQLDSSREKLSQEESSWNLHAQKIRNPVAEHSRFQDCVVFPRDECERLAAASSQDTSHPSANRMPSAASTGPTNQAKFDDYPVKVTNHHPSDAIPVYLVTPPSAEPPIQYVTLDQAAAVVNRGKKALRRLRNKPHSDMPLPDVKGGGGKPDEWIWNNLRPWLEKTFSKKLPETFPTRS